MTEVSVVLDDGRVQGVMGEGLVLGAIGRRRQHRHCQADRPSPTAFPRRVVDACSGAQRGTTVGVEQHPRHTEVGRRVTRAQVTEIDHGDESAVIDDEVAGMEIAVHPGGRTGPRCGNADAGPGGDDDVGVDQVGELRCSGAGDLVALGERVATMGVRRRVGRCSAVERGDELAERGRSCDGIGRRSDRRWGTLDPRADAPSPGVPLRRTSVEPGSRDLQRETGSEAMEPRLLVFDEVRPELAAGQPHDLVVAESEQDVVPPLVEEAE